MWTCKALGKKRAAEFQFVNGLEPVMSASIISICGLRQILPCQLCNMFEDLWEHRGISCGSVSNQGS